MSKIVTKLAFSATVTQPALVSQLWPLVRYDTVYLHSLKSWLLSLNRLLCDVVNF